MTTIRVFNEVACRESTFHVPFPLDEAVNRLRTAIGEPEFDVFTTTAIYARVAGKSIDLYCYGIDWEPAQAELNRIMSEVEGRVTA